MNEINSHPYLVSPGDRVSLAAKPTPESMLFQDSFFFLFFYSAVYVYLLRLPDTSAIKDLPADASYEALTIYS